MVVDVAGEIIRADMAKPNADTAKSNADTCSFPMEDSTWGCMKAHGL